MKLTDFLSKPRWLSKDAATRRAAVIEDSDSELLANLGRLAREDPDAQVRIVAMKRLADPGIAQGLAHDDSDAVVRAQARALWLDLLTGTHASAPPLVERLRLLKAQDDPELISHIARRAPDATLREAALARSSRPALLVERALEDPDPAIRVGLVERLDDEAQLARLAERARKSDKQVSRAARERIDALRIARGHDATLEQRAGQLCEQLEQRVRNPNSGEAEADIAARWVSIEPSVPAPLRARYQAAQDLLAASRNRAAAITQSNQELSAPDAATRADAQAGSETDAEPAPGASDQTPDQADADIVAAELIAQARFAVSLTEAKAAQAKKKELQDALFAELDVALRESEAALESGSSAQAHQAKASIDSLRKRIEAPLPRAFSQRLAEAESRYAKVSQWQHWADNQRRRQLCDEIDALAASGVHPDAVAARVREAQSEWTRLDQIEGRITAKPSGLARRFQGACRAAMAPTQGYFKKRQELRQSHAQAVHALLERAATFNADTADWSGIAALRTEMIAALRGLDSVEPRERKTLAHNLKTALDALDALVVQRDEAVATAKAALIQKAKALVGDGVQRGAVAAARELQQRWQQAGNGKRSRDQGQWKEFRAAVDAVFAQLDAERTERTAREVDARRQAEELCAEFEAFAASSDQAERGAAGRLQTAWEGLRVRDDDLNARFKAAQARVREASEQAVRSRRHARFEAWLTRFRLCRAAETGAEPIDLLQDRWNAAATTDIAATVLSERFEQAASGVATDFDADMGPELQDVLLELEFLAGIEAHEADRERRRSLQVERLAARMRGAHASAPADELAELMSRWTALYPSPEPSLDARLERAVSAVLETLS